MAKNRKRRGRRRNFFAMKAKTDLALGALGIGATVQQTMTAFGVTRVWCISGDFVWSLEDGGAAQGPILVGLSSSNLSVTEINENLDARPTSQGDIIAMERSRRPVREVGSMLIDAQGHGQIADGRLVRTKLGFWLNEGEELVAWARNEDNAALQAGAIVHVAGKLYLRWA